MFAFMPRRRYLNRITIGAMTLLALPLLITPASARQRLNLRGLLDLSVTGGVWGSDIDSRFQLDNNLRLSDMNLRLANGGMRTELGQVSANWDDLSFANRGFLGLKIGVPTGKLSTTLLGGSVAIQDRWGRHAISPVYGLRAGWALNNRLNLNASQLFTPAASDEQGKSISALSISYALQRNTRLAAELAHSRGGTGWQVSGAHSGKNLVWKALYRQADVGFSTAGNPLLSMQREGYFGEMRYKKGALALNMASQRYEDGRGGRDFVERATLSFSKPKHPSVSVYWQSSDQLSLPFLPIGFTSDEENALRRLELRPTVAQSTGVQISHAFSGNSVSLGFERGQSRVIDTPFSSQKADRFNLFFSRPLGQRTSTRFYHSWNVNSSAQANADQAGQFTQVNVSHYLRNGINFDVGLQRQEYRSNRINGSAIASEIGLYFPVGATSSVGVQYRTYLSASGSAALNSDMLQIRLSRRVNFGRRRSGQARTPEQRLQLGRILGRVFEDTNNNGKWDSGEPPVPNVSLALRNDLQQRSSRQGLYSFADLSPANYKVRLVMKTLPTEFAVLAPTEVPVLVASAKTTTVDFPAVRTGEIRGIVFQDTNRNGQRDQGEVSMPNAVVQVEGSDVISFSNERGEFALCNLPPQSWRLSVDTQFLGNGYETTLAGPLEIKVPPSGAVTGVQIGIAQQQREITPSFVLTSQSS